MDCGKRIKPTTVTNGLAEKQSKGKEKCPRQLRCAESNPDRRVGSKNQAIDEKIKLVKLDLTYMNTKIFFSEGLIYF